MSLLCLGVFLIYYLLMFLEAHRLILTFLFLRLRNFHKIGKGWVKMFIALKHHLFF